MSAKVLRPSAQAIARIRALSERELTPEEVEAALRTPVDEVEREEILALVAWFRRRYPTAADRLAYVRRAYHRWQGAASLPK